MFPLLSHYPENAQWSLEELVDEANALLPLVLPQEAGKGSEAISPRTVRFYASEGLLDSPERQWREARYSLRHLLQLLAVRKLMSEGYGLRLLVGELGGKSNEELIAILENRVQLGLNRPEAANPALAYLAELEQNLTPRARSTPTRSSTEPPLSKPEPLQRLRLKEGLELLVGPRFRPPRSKVEWQRLLQEIEQALKHL
jgi:DNA-binding transcriptional MerR regulator